MTTAREGFDATITRSIDLFHLARHWHDGCPSHHHATEGHKAVYTDIGRSGVVLAVAAMDAYFTRRFSELLVPYLKAKGTTKALSELLESAGLDVAQALALAIMDRPFRRIRALVDGYLERYTAQKSDRIDSLFAAYGLTELSKHAMNKAGRKTLKRSVAILVERRHQIVHEGDLNKHGKLNDFDWVEMAKRLRDLKMLVDAADQIIESFSVRLK